MGADESKYRITRTDSAESPWLGFCTVIGMNETKDKLIMPDGSKHKFLFINKHGIRILEGRHRGYYDLENIY
mgnify:CR=1 FL=1|tara:strand:+ start:426 stop:641 length:216 start_codon:yes stop_codon:yes gene_type:complete